MKRIVEDILASGRKLKAIALFETTPAVKKEQEAVLSEIEKLTSELQAIGCNFKDWNFEVGLVDFPAIIEEKEVLLCWRSDEQRIEWYHDHLEGYTGRKPIPDYLLTQNLQ